MNGMMFKYYNNEDREGFLVLKFDRQEVKEIFRHLSQRIPSEPPTRFEI